MLHVFKRSRNAHIMFIFTVYAYWTSDIFLQKKTLEFLFQDKKPFIHSTFCGWKCFEIFITHSLEDGFVHVRFSNMVESTEHCKM